MRVTELLSLAFRKLALDLGGQDKPPARIWLSQDPEVLHPLFERLAEKYQTALPALQKLSFTREGAFSYSPELTDALGTLQLTGAISRLNPTFDRFSPIIYQGSDEVLTEQLKRAFGNDKETLENFNSFVKDLKELVVEATQRQPIA